MERLSGLKQLPENGQLFTRSQWQREVTSYRIWSGDEEVEDAKDNEKEANESLKTKFKISCSFQTDFEPP